VLRQQLHERWPLSPDEKNNRFKELFLLEREEGRQEEEGKVVKCIMTVKRRGNLRSGARGIAKFKHGTSNEPGRSTCSSYTFSLASG